MESQRRSSFPWPLVGGAVIVTAICVAAWPVASRGLSFGLQAGVAILAGTVAAVAAVRYRDERDPHDLFLAAGLAVLAVQAFAFGVVLAQLDPLEIRSSAFAPDAFGILGPEGGAVPPLAWQGGWVIAGVCLALATARGERRGRRPTSWVTVAGVVAAAVILLDAALLTWGPSLTSSDYRSLVAEAVPAPGMLGAVSWLFAMAAIAAVTVAAVRESGRAHRWASAALIAAVPLLIAVLFRPTEGLPLVQWADLLQPAVIIALLAQLVSSARTDAFRARRATDRAEDVLGARAEIAGMIAHEVRGPVASIRGLAGTTLAHYERLNDDERREFIGMIEIESARLLEVVDQTSLALKLDAGTVATNMRSADLGVAVAAGAARVDTGEHPVHVDAAPGLVMPIDPDHVAQIVRQLLTNAVRFSPADAPVSVFVRAQDGGVAIEVTDAGPGIPEDERDAVFERFVRWRPAGYETQPGTGLGLFISRTLAGRMGGSISVVDAPGGGTMLRVRLPSEG